MTDLNPSDLDDAWKVAVQTLSSSVSSAAQLTWLDDTQPVGLSDGIFVLSAPNPFAQEQMKRRFSDDLVNALSGAVGQPVQVLITARADDTPAETISAPVPLDDPPEMRLVENKPSPSPTSTVTSNSLAEANLSDKYVFDRFVIGPGNRFAHAAAFAVAEAPAKAYNPLFIYGDSGLGKTHLLQAIGHYIGRLYPRTKITYVTSEQFTSEFIEGVRRGQQAQFQRRYRDVDILLIDDIQFLEKAERTQEEFFHTFNALHHAEKQIVLTSDRPPRQLERLEARLVTRFEMGLLTDVQPPDLETRLAILRRKADIDDVAVPGDVLELIAGRISTNIRELEGALIRVIAAASLSKQPVTMSLAETALKDVFPEARTGDITAELIIDETATYFNLTPEELCSKKRTRSLVNARQIAMYLTRELTELSLPKIGEAFGGRDHTTVMHANKKITKLIKERAATFEQIQDLTSHIKLRARG
ncbi:chromosomal replication initiator protein DnaA [Euzebya tangerina]|uniref:chromosomal replication initiator protein DnaA n=1 Tax=Euzebya tangerina TaxID=591198 RepID=UPI001F0C11D6|nr:chromosomal replication initiator protein DnaA [Euzebya tangerina]